MEEVEKVTDHSRHSIKRHQNHWIRLSILCILRCGIEFATVSNHCRQFQTISIGMSTAVSILMAADRGVKEWACGDIPLYRFHVMRRKIMRSKGFRKLQCP